MHVVELLEHADVSLDDRLAYCLDALSPHIRSGQVPSKTEAFSPRSTLRPALRAVIAAANPAPVPGGSFAGHMRQVRAFHGQSPCAGSCGRAAFGSIRSVAAPRFTTKLIASGLISHILCGYEQPTSKPSAARFRAATRGPAMAAAGGSRARGRPYFRSLRLSSHLAEAAGRRRAAGDLAAHVGIEGTSLVRLLSAKPGSWCAGTIWRTAAPRPCGSPGRENSSRSASSAPSLSCVACLGGGQ